MRNKMREDTAKAAANCIKSQVPSIVCYPETAIILGTGWDEAMTENLIYCQTLRLVDLPGFDALRNLEQIEGHRRELVLGIIRRNNGPVAMLRGRIHSNESHNGEELMRMVRLQVEMLIMLGVKNLILTNAAGSLRPRGFCDVVKSLFKPKVRVGDIVTHDSFVTAFAPPPPYWGGEFETPEDVLKPENIEKVMDAARAAGLNCHVGVGAMWRGPNFEGRKHDKMVLRQAGATVCMMSIVPETEVAVLYQGENERVNVYTASLIVNNDIEEPLHKTNQERAKELSAKLGQLLLNLIDSL